MPSVARHSRIMTAIKLIAAIALTELCIMFLFDYLHMESLLTQVQVNLADAFLLSVGASVVIYWWVVRPMKSVDEYQEAKEAATRALSLLEATLESTADGILVVDNAGRIAGHNEKFREMWGIPAAVLEAGDDEQALRHVLDHLVDPEGFLRKVKELYANPGNVSCDMLEFNDGRVFERYSQPQQMGGKILGRVWSFRDVTERKRDEERIRLSAERYRSLFENSMDAIYITQREGPFIDVNKAALDLFGYTRDEMIGMDVKHVYADPADRIRFQAAIEAAGAVRDYEVRFRKKDGWVMDCLLTSTVLRDEAGDVIGYQGIMRDISEKKRIEIELKESEEWLRTIFEASPAGIVVVDPEGRITFANGSMEQIFGWAHNELAGVRYPELVHESERAIGDSTMQKLIRGDIELVAIERHYQRKDGSDFWGFLSGRRLVGSDGRLRALLGIITDITDRKKMEQQLLEIKQDWEDTFNTITDMITVHDGDFNIIRANRAAEQILNLPFLGMTKVKCYTQYHGTGCPPEGCPSCQVLKTGKSTTSEIFEPHLGRHIEIRAIPRLDRDQQLIGLIHVVRDITEHRKLEDQFRQAQKMEAVGQLAGGVAHDFNNILSAIIGYGHLLLMKMADDDPLRTNVDQIMEASERAATLTHSLLAFSRKQMISLKPVDLNDLLKKFEKFLLRLVREDIVLRVVCPDEGIVVMADSGQIEQALMNLVTNARDAMPEGGELVIRTERVHIDNEFMKLDGHGKPGDYARITVTDSGMGMDEETSKKIFEPFFTTKEQGKGTGLGLAMVYGTIKQHGGYITVRSRPGQGTTFTIFLPLVGSAVEKLRDEGAQDVQPPMRGNETILLAEDDDALRRLGSTVLGQFGYTVIEAVDGEDAIMKFVENRDRIQLVILDAIMPKKNGREVYDNIRLVAPSMKVLFASGYSSDVIGPKGITADEVEFMLKPISPKDLLKKVRNILDA